MHLLDTPDNRTRARRVADLVAAALRAGCGLTEIDELLGYRPREPLAVRSVGTTLRTAYETWSAATDHGVRPTTQRNRRWAFEKHVLPAFGDRTLDTIGSADIAGLQSHLLQIMAVTSAQKVLESALQACWTWCHEQHPPLVSVPSASLFGSLRWPQQRSGDPEPFTPDERDRIVAWMDAYRPEFAAYVHLLFWSGMRPSEASALTWRHVDLDGRQLWVVASRVGRSVGAPKTTRARRRVELHPDTIARLAALPRGGPDDAVFVAGKVPMLREHIAPRLWPRCLDELGITYRGLYATKDTFVSLQLVAGSPPAWIEDQTGVDWSTLRRHYGRWMAGERRLFVTPAPIRGNN